MTHRGPYAVGSYFCGREWWSVLDADGRIVAGGFVSQAAAQRHADKLNGGKL